jgi:hypothetical protein
MKIVILFFLLSVLVFGQNPDGKKVSLHASVFSNAGEVSVFSDSLGSGSRQFNFDGKLSYNLMIKIPFHQITFSPFFEYNYISFGVPGLNKSTRETKLDYKFKMSKFGATISFYFE